MDNERLTTGGHRGGDSVTDVPRLLVMLCTYNERANLERLIPEIFRYAPDADLLVIDDNSPDGTSELVEELQRDNDRIHLLRRAGKLGLGTATLAGFRYAVERDYTRLVNMDADYSHHPRHLPALRSCAERADVAIGSRYVSGGGVEGWGLGRHLMSRCINTYARLLLGLKTRDNSGSYRCYRVDKLREVDFDRCISHGYAFQEEVLYRCRRIGCTFIETPIFFADRRFGTSKINWREAVRAVWDIFRLSIHRLLRTPVRRLSE